MLSDDDSHRLDALLLSIPMNDDGMLLSEFDGFCAGLVVCPKMILPGEWLPCVWGENTEQFEALADVQLATEGQQCGTNLPAQPLCRIRRYQSSSKLIYVNLTRSIV